MSRPGNAPALSIVIPAPSDSAALEATLVSVLENRPADCEIVVSLGFEYADPWNIADEVRLGHQAGAEAAVLHAVGRAADIEIDFVIAELFADRRTLRERGRLGAAELQRDRML